MTSIITGDIINSRSGSNEIWLNALKAIFQEYGTSPKTWEIYRGDSFQIEIDSITETTLVALKIKATIKSLKNIDVRMAIGIGSKTYDASAISESNGQAFIHSGSTFEALKKETLAIRTPWEEIDEELNLLFSFAQTTMNSWTQNSAEIARLTLYKPHATQIELAKILNITQGRVSERQKRAGLDELLKMEKRYRKLIQKKI